MEIVTIGFFPSNPSRTQDWSFRIDDWLESDLGVLIMIEIMIIYIIVTVTQSPSE